jgi:hypothetical protein
VLHGCIPVIIMDNVQVDFGFGFSHAYGHGYGCGCGPLRWRRTLASMPASCPRCLLSPLPALACTTPRFNPTHVLFAFPPRPCLNPFWTCPASQCESQRPT